MVLGFGKKGPGSAGCYGKLPLHGDYVSHANDGPEARRLSTWMDEGYRLTRGHDNPDAAEVCFLLVDGRRAIFGVFWPSGDASGTRRFPFALFVPTPSKTIGPFGATIPEAIVPAILNLTKAYPDLREAGSPDRITSLMSAIHVPPFPDPASVRSQFGRDAAQSLSADAAKPVLFEVMRFTDALGSTKKGAPNFAVRIPLTTEFAPSAEASAWLDILGRRLGDPNLGSSSSLFVRPPRGAACGELVVIHRELRPDDLGFVLTPTEDYPYGNCLGNDTGGEEAAAFAASLETPEGTEFTLADLVRAGIA